ncbi:MAG: MgtC/SapB family protein [Synergistaceae bacterium]|nr:MgtC/SapB family protein [Synergistaceae bacterium]
MYLGKFEILCRLLLAAFLGAVFGMERRHRNKPIGARTHILISLAACTVAIISSYGFTELAYSYPHEVSVRTDPARLMVGMLTGIGFIGAGIIYKRPHGDIKGITTAAEVYLVTVLGIGSGLGLYMLSISASVIAYITLICSEDMVSCVKEKYCVPFKLWLKKLFHRRNSRE